MLAKTWFLYISESLYSFNQLISRYPINCSLADKTISSGRCADFGPSTAICNWAANSLTLSCKNNLIVLIFSDFD